MKLFVTGATGFIGSNFVKVALDAGHRVLALRRSPDSKPRVAWITLPEIVDAALDAITPQQLADCDVIVHLAAHTPNVPYDTLENCLRWNVMAPLALFRVAMAAGIDRFVIAGSCFEYGDSGNQHDFIPTTAPLVPTQTYPASKAAASIVFSQLAMQHRLRLSIHRIFQVYGEGESPQRLWPSLRRAAMAGEDLDMTPSEQVRDFVNVATVAQKLLAACERTDIEPGRPVIENLGSGQPMTVRQFAETWWRRWNATGTLHFGALPYRDGEVMRYVPELPTESFIASEPIQKPGSPRPASGRGAGGEGASDRSQSLRESLPPC